MELIKLFLLGASGYLLAALYDIALLFRKYRLSRILYAGFFVTALPFVWLFIQHRSPHSSLVTVLLLLLMGISLLLVVYSVLLEIPLKKSETDTLYTKGTYRLCRHPGFWWYSFFTLFSAVYFWYAPIVLVHFGFILCNFLLVVLEDFVLFPRMFPQYGEYKKVTPFLFPF